MIAGAWICLLAPLATARSDHAPRRDDLAPHGGWLSTFSVFTAFGGAVCSSASSAGSTRSARLITTAWTWLAAGDLDVGLTLLIDPLSVTMMLIVSGVGGLIVLYSIGYMRTPRSALLRLHGAVRLLDAHARAGGNFLLLLVGWGLVGSPRTSDRLLARAARGGRGREEGLRDERVRRRDDGARPDRALLADGNARLRARSRGRASVADARQPRRARPARRRGRRSRRSCRSTRGCRMRWRPDAGLRADPRGDDDTPAST